jgi:nucleotide-binding universal stress UspA family protein
MRVLIAIDGSEFADAAVAAVAERLWPVGSEFLLLFALEPYPTLAPELWTLPPTDYRTLEALTRERANLFLARAAETLEAAGVAPGAVTTRIAVGSAKDVILDEAHEWKADLVMVGSHGRTALGRFVIGSVADAALLHAPCSVEIVRRAKAE